MPKGRLYLVPTPIGNLGDMTLRAIETLRNVALIAAEDTRTARKLLNHFEIAAPKLISYHKFSEKSRSPEILGVLTRGEDVAIVSDAGSPGISDPAEIIVRDAIARGFEVIALPGATALIPALTASGLPCGAFLFLGFLPTHSRERKDILKQIKDSPVTAILYEAPHRLRTTLTELYKAIGKRKVVIAREISKIYEEYIRGNLDDVLEDYQVTEKGEFVILIEAIAPDSAPDPLALKSLILAELESGKSPSEIVKALSPDYPKNLIYKLILEMREHKA